MPVPSGWHQVPGDKNHYFNSESGEIVTRWQARNLGAREMGYANESQRSKGNDRYYHAFLNSDQGQRAIERAREMARESGKPFNESQFKRQVIEARNARPHKGKPAGKAFQSFVGLYLDLRDWLIRY